MADPFDIFLTSRVSVRKADGQRLDNLPSSVRGNTIQLNDPSLPIDEGDIMVHHLPNGRDHLYEVTGVSLKEGIEGHIPTWLELSCQKLFMPVFGRYVPVTVIRGAGSPGEQRWDTRMGGDLRSRALFHLNDRIKTGDELHADYFDEPRVIAAVHPCTGSGTITHWEVEMTSRSEWKRLHTEPHPPIFVSGQGSRVNVNSVDQSVQQFYNAHGQGDVLKALDELKGVIGKAALSPEERNDAAIDVDQLKAELQRSKPNPNRVGTFIDNLKSVTGLAESVAKLIPLLKSVLPE